MAKIRKFKRVQVHFPRTVKLILILTSEFLIFNCEKLGVNALNENNPPCIYHCETISGFTSAWKEWLKYLALLYDIFLVGL